MPANTMMDEEEYLFNSPSISFLPDAIGQSLCGYSFPSRFDLSLEGTKRRTRQLVIQAWRGRLHGHATIH